MTRGQRKTRSTTPGSPAITDVCECGHEFGRHEQKAPQPCAGLMCACQRFRKAHAPRFEDEPMAGTLRHMAGLRDKVLAGLTDKERSILERPGGSLDPKGRELGRVADALERIADAIERHDVNVKLLEAFGLSTKQALELARRHAKNKDGT